MGSEPLPSFDGGTRPSVGKAGGTCRTLSYSLLSATFGSTRDARRAGRALQRPPTVTRTTVAATTERPSKGVTPKSNVEMSWPPRNTTGRPITSPVTTSHSGLAHDAPQPRRTRGAERHPKTELGRAARDRVRKDAKETEARQAECQGAKSRTSSAGSDATGPSRDRPARSSSRCTRSATREPTASARPATTQSPVPVGRRSGPLTSREPPASVTAGRTRSELVPPPAPGGARRPRCPRSRCRPGLTETAADGLTVREYIAARVRFTTATFWLPVTSPPFNARPAIIVMPTVEK